MKRRKQPRSKVFIVSFVLVLALLVGGAFLLTYLAGQPVVRHLPSTLPAYTPVWASYAPSGALQFTLRNYTAVRALNSSAYSTGSLFTSLSPAYTLDLVDVRTLISVVFSQPNATVDIALVDPEVFASFYSTMQSNVTTPVVEGDARLYFTQLVGSSGFVSGWLLAIPSNNAIGFCQGVTPARTAIDDVLAVRNGSASSIFKRTDVTQMFYIVGGPNRHLAFTVQNFPGLVSTGQMTVQVVDLNQSLARSTYVVKFNSPDTALSQYDFVRAEYFTGQYFAIYDQYVLAQKSQPLSNLVSAIQSVG